MSIAFARPLAGTWRADITHSRLAFAVRHMSITTFTGDVEDFEATLVAAPDGELELRGAGRVASIVTRDPALTQHIAAPDFFDADRHPEIRLASRSMILRDGRVQADAVLTIKGRERPVWLTGTLDGPVDDPFGGTRLGLSLETVVDRRDFGLDFVIPLPGGGVALGFKVRLTAELELVLED